MATFTIDSENKIAGYTPGEAVPESNAERFTTEGELAELAAHWPAARLVEVWNSIPGSKPVKKFTDRKTAVTRIWKAAQSLVSRHNAPDVAPKAARSGKRTSRKPKGHTGRDGSKKAKVLALLERAKGATLAELDVGHRLAGAQRAWLHLEHPRQETQIENRLVQDREG